MTEKEQLFRMTGNPFVDGGAIALSEIIRKPILKQIKKDDVKLAIKKIRGFYTNWQNIGSVFTRNALFSNPSIKNKGDEYSKFLLELVEKLQPFTNVGDCSSCGGRTADNFAFREKLPLTGSGSLLNFFSFFDGGFTICSNCLLATQFLPLYLISNSGKCFLVHTSNHEIMQYLAKQAITSIVRQSTIGKIKFYCPVQFRKNNLDEFSIEIIRKIVSDVKIYDNTPKVRIYSFINSGQINKIDFVDIPTEIFDFFIICREEGLNKNIEELFHNSSKSIYWRLLNNMPITLNFLKNRRILGGWILLEKYLLVVEKMDKERLDSIVCAGDKLYAAYIKNKKILKKIESLDKEKYSVAIGELTKLQKEETLISVEDFTKLFPESSTGAINWKETIHLLLMRVYEKINANKGG